MHSNYVAKHSFHKIGVGGVCIRNEEILFVKHTYGVSKGKWTIPGGYVELGESLSQAIEREVFEETGVHSRAASILALRHMTNEKKNKGLISDLYVVFKLEYISGNPISRTNETSESRFISLERESKSEISNLSRFIVGNVIETDEFNLLPYVPDEDIKTRLNVHDYQLYG
ncbi:MAG: NUDIX domain-containing protein [Candidatus Heimdallarchaeota archaeon]|nr:NUDIX domain-containing protein [Candidatus Heimdallarchaeota archaeon]